MEKVIFTHHSHYYWHHHSTRDDERRIPADVTHNREGTRLVQHGYV